MLSGLSEMLTLASLVPLIAFLTTPESNSGLNLPNSFNLFELPRFINSPLIVISAFIFLVIISVLTRLLFRWVNFRLAGAIGADFGTAAFRKILYLPYQSILNINSSEIVSITTIFVRQLVVVVNNILLLISSLVITLGLIFTLLIIDWKTTLVGSFILINSYIIISLLNKNTVFSNSISMIQLESKQVKIVQESIGGIRDIILNS